MTHKFVKRTRTLVNMLKVDTFRGHNKWMSLLMLVSVTLYLVANVATQAVESQLNNHNNDYETNQDQSDYVSPALTSQRLKSNQNQSFRRPISETSRSQEHLINNRNTNDRQQIGNAKRDVDASDEIDSVAAAGSQPAASESTGGDGEDEEISGSGGSDSSSSLDYNTSTGGEDSEQEVPISTTATTATTTSTTTTQRPLAQQVVSSRRSSQQQQVVATNKPLVSLMDAGHQRFLSTTPKLIMQPLAQATTKSPSMPHAHQIHSHSQQPQANNGILRVERHQSAPDPTNPMSTTTQAHWFNANHQQPRNHQIASSTASPISQLSSNSSTLMPTILSTVAAATRMSSTQQPAITLSVGPEPVSVNRQQMQASGSATNFASRMAPNLRQSQEQQQQQRVATTTTSATTTANSRFTTTDSMENNAEHLLLEPHQLNQYKNGRQAVPSNERRQDLLYPQASNFQESTYTGRQQPPNSHSLNGFSLDQSDPNFQVPTICYTPLALLMVILATVLITVVICFSTHVLIKHLGRHQFDLIENSKKFHGKHAGYSLGSGTNQRSPGGQHATNWSVPQTISTSQQHLHLQDGGFNATTTNTTLATSGYTSHQQPLEHCAFDNPYFHGSSSGGGGVDEITQAGHWHQQHQHQNHSFGSGSKPLVGGLLTQAPYSPADLQYHQQVGVLASGTPATTIGGSDERPLNFIENHISNLHSRQVTSSVSELGKSAAQVVDLTSEEQRARIIADPQEGDLVAVDITGHDFIGLGFDVCGSPQEGIFIRTVLSRGPARESGCVEPGDRIKCLNISFDNITLEDAYDILNCGAPYKMRLLLEKRILPDNHHLLDRTLRSPVAHLSGGSRQRSAARLHQYQNQLTQSLDDRHQLTSGGGPLSATKTYLKRLTSKLVAPSSGAQGASGSASSNTSPASTSSVSQLHQAVSRLNQQAVSQYLHHQPDPYNNQQEQHHSRPIFWSPVYSPVEGNPTNNTSSGLSEVHENAGYLGAESDTEIVPNLRADLNRNESIEYKSKNANHKLHGPKISGHHLPRINRDLSKDIDVDEDGIDGDADEDIEGGCGIEQSLPLGGLASLNQNKSRRHRPNPSRSHSMGEALAHQTKETMKDALVGAKVMDRKGKQRLVDAHLDQSQSQPEIANLNLREEATLESGAGDESKSAHNIRHEDTGDEVSETNVADGVNGKKSVSTPAVNLLAGNLNQPRVWRVSTRRNKSRVSESSVNELVREEEPPISSLSSEANIPTKSTTTLASKETQQPPT